MIAHRSGDFMPERMLNILLVEDDELDLQTARRYIDDPQVRLHIANDAINAIHVLKQRVISINNKEKWLILLDLNLPGAHGLDFLSFLRTAEEWSHIPIVVMSSSQDHHDIERAYRQHVSGYFVKTVDVMTLRRRLRAVITYWLESEMSA
jgi:CheY-like chemotaxis protein